MTKYKVVVTPEAQAGIVQAFDYIHERAPLNATRWLRALYKQLDTLERLPERCPRARESVYLEEDLRQLLFHSHRVVFRIDQRVKMVFVLWVRHAKMRAVGERPED